MPNMHHYLFLVMDSVFQVLITGKDGSQLLFSHEAKLEFCGSTTCTRFTAMRRSFCALRYTSDTALDQLNLIKY